MTKVFGEKNALLPSLNLDHFSIFHPRGTAIAQWIRLHLPFCHPGSSPKHIIYAFIIYSICVIFVMWKEQKQTKRGQVWPFLTKEYFPLKVHEIKDKRILNFLEFIFLQFAEFDWICSLRRDTFQKK